MIWRPPRSTLFPTRRSSDLIRSTPTGRAVTRVPMGIGWLQRTDRKSTRLNSSHRCISYAVFCLKKKTIKTQTSSLEYTHTITALHGKETYASIGQRHKSYME